MENREEYNDEINLLDYINVLKKHIKLISIIVASAVVYTVITSLLATNIYQSKAIIMPATQSSGQSNMSAIAMQFGISTPSTANVSEVVSLLKTNILMERVVKRYNLISVFSKEKLKEKSANEKTWYGIRYLKGIFKVNHKGGIIELSVEYKDPKTATDILNYILTELTDYMSSEAKRVAETNQKYLESLINKNADPLIRQKIYSLIAKQIETSMMAEVKENFAFKVLDPPKVPDTRIKPRRRRNVMLAFVISLFAGVFIAFFIEYVENVRKRDVQERRDTREMSK